MSYIPTESDKKRAEQLRLQADWEIEHFPVQFLTSDGEWKDCMDCPDWHRATTYRRKPEPEYAPWTREDVEQFRGIWVRQNSGCKGEWIIDGFCYGNGNVHVVEWISLDSLFSEYTKLDGTPCGKLEASK